MYVYLTVCDLESSPVRRLRLELGCFPLPPPKKRREKKQKRIEIAFVSNALRYVKERSFGDSQVSPACPSDKCVIKIGETEEQVENSFQFHFVPTDCAIGRGLRGESRRLAAEFL